MRDPAISAITIRCFFRRRARTISRYWALMASTRGCTPSRPLGTSVERTMVVLGMVA